MAASFAAILSGAPLMSVCASPRQHALEVPVQGQISDEHSTLVVIERGAHLLVKGQIPKMRMGIETLDVLHQQTIQQFPGPSDLPAVFELMGLQDRIAIELLIPQTL